MEKLIECRYWKEYQGLNGWTMFCSAGAFAKVFDRKEADEIGCTDQQRAICKKTMEQNIGYGLLPKITAAAKESTEDKVKTPAERELAATLNRQ
jgi:hypothetical protein